MKSIVIATVLIAAGLQGMESRFELRMPVTPATPTTPTTQGLPPTPTSVSSQSSEESILGAVDECLAAKLYLACRHERAKRIND